MNVISRGIRNAFRNQIRTFSIVVILGLSVGLALAMLVAYQAVGKKIDSIKSSIGNTVTITPAGARGFEGGGNPLTQSEINKVKILPHVASVDESLADRLTASDTNLQSAVDAGALGRRFAQRSGQTFTAPLGGENRGNGGSVSFTPPVIVLGTTNPSGFAASQGGTAFALTAGKIFDGASTDNVAVVGSALAAKNNLSAGSEFTAYSTNIKVIGIYDAGSTFANNQIVMPLATVQKLSSQADTLTTATVNVDSIGNVDSVTAAAKTALADTADVTNSAEQAKNTLAPLQNIRSISLYSLVGSVIAGAVIILLTMIMIVRERRREIGVIKAIGASNIKVMAQFMVEAVTLTAMGAAIGIVLGVVAGNPITRLLVSNSASTATNQTVGGRLARGAFGGFRNNVSSIHGAVGWSIILYGLIAAIIIALLGSSIASFSIAKVRPAEVMRSE